MIDQNALEAEHRIIAICCENPKKIQEVTALDQDFAAPQWRACMRALRELQAEHGDELDSLTVMDRINASDLPLGYDDLINLAAEPHMLGRYSDMVREAACKRRLLSGLSEVMGKAKAGHSASECVSEASQVLAQATMGQPDQARTIGQLASARILEISEMAEAKAKGDKSATGIPSGIQNLDDLIGGFQLGIPTVIAARPGMGKSALSLNITNHASKAGIGVHVFSLEDTSATYTDRVLSMGSRVSGEDIRCLNLNSHDLGAIRSAAERIHKRKHWLVDDRSGITAEEVVACARRNMERNETRMVIVDYIQLLRGRYNQGTREKLDEAMHIFGDAAKRDRMAYVILSQLNRNLESRDDKRPLLSDLKESGTIEERAKCVLMLYRGHVYSNKVSESEMEILVRKNTAGRTGTAMAEWIPEQMRIK